MRSSNKRTILERRNEVMELDELFKEVNRLTSKFPELNNEEVFELRRLASHLGAEMGCVIWEREYYGNSSDDEEDIL